MAKRRGFGHIKMSERAKARRSDPANDVVVDGVCENSLILADDYDEELMAEMTGSSICISNWERSGPAPIIAWDASFEQYLRERTANLEAVNAAGFSWYPWNVIPSLTTDFRRHSLLATSQQSRPSCAGFSAGIAYNATAAISIALGQPMLYNPCNPLITWFISKGGSYRGGQSISTIGRFVNEVGNFPASLVGTNVITVPSDYRQHMAAALQYASGICWMPAGPVQDQVERVIRVARAGLGMFYGNRGKVSSSRTDSNGVRLAVMGGSWNHAVGWNSYARVRSEEYVGWWNSHGPRYTAQDILGMPADGAWMNRAILAETLKTAAGYGRIGIVVPKSTPVPFTGTGAIVQARNAGLARA